MMNDYKGHFCSAFASTDDEECVDVPDLPEGSRLPSPASAPAPAPTPAPPTAPGSLVLHSPLCDPITPVVTEFVLAQAPVSPQLSLASSSDSIVCSIPHTPRYTLQALLLALHPARHLRHTVVAASMWRTSSSASPTTVWLICTRLPE